MQLPFCVLVLVATASACSIRPKEVSADKSPGDNFYRVVINGDIERYIPEQRYFVTLVGSRTHDVVQKFTRFKLMLEPQYLQVGSSPYKQGQFQLFADTLTKFDEECINSVVEHDDLPKTEVQVMWKAPASGSGCVLIKAMVMENETSWFAEDGQLTKRICEDVSVKSHSCCPCDEAMYDMLFQGLWSSGTHPKDFPTQAAWLTHFSDIIGASHGHDFSFWGEGHLATDGFRSLAEWGSVDLLERELRQKGHQLRSIVKAQGLWYPHVNDNTTSAFTVDRKRNLVSLVSMFGPSPDWVVGVSGLDLCDNQCTWVQDKVVDLFPYDAGTDNGVTYMSPNAPTIPREKMHRITNRFPEDPRSPFYDPKHEMAPLARLYLTRKKIIPRSCNEASEQVNVEENQPVPEQDNTGVCGVTEWTPWSPCSVTCGKGLRMRLREYRMPQKAQMFFCDRQLVSKEMCVAAVAECADGQNQDAPLILFTDTEVSERESMCETREWSSWSECSVTCGVGVSTRRRQFVNHMGFKKCPLIPTEENRKCTMPPCKQDELEVTDPTCPTTEWSAWSPCSASCGRGVRFRTRLLLVPAEKQENCSARVELLQQRPCVEKENCTVDLATAHSICTEQPERGPCRGVYQRWGFVSQKGICMTYSFGGCRGSRNNFLTEEDCLNTCQMLVNDAALCRLPDCVTIAHDISHPLCPTTEWTEWGRCSASCGLGVRFRTRLLLVPKDHVEPCATKVELLQQKPCKARNCTGVFLLDGSAPGPAHIAVPIITSNIHRDDALKSIVVTESDEPDPDSRPCQLSEWSEWSECSVTCGSGFQQRTRQILAPAGANAKPCPKRNIRHRRCYRSC